MQLSVAGVSCSMLLRLEIHDKTIKPLFDRQLIPNPTGFLPTVYRAHEHPVRAPGDAQVGLESFLAQLGRQRLGTLAILQARQLH